MNLDQHRIMRPEFARALEDMHRRDTAKAWKSLTDCLLLAGLVATITIAFLLTLSA